MATQTTLSAKGQIVLPKDVREALALTPGMRFDVASVGGAILLTPQRDERDLDVEGALALIRAMIQYDGPPVSIEEMNATIDDMWAASGQRSDCARG